LAITLERLVTSGNAFGLTEATLCQRAVCRIADGLPYADLLEQSPSHVGEPELRPSLERAFGLEAGAELPLAHVGIKPLELYILSGIRTAKSLMCAGIALRSALTVDLSNLRPWEEPCVSVLSITLRKAKIIMRHLKGPLLARPPLRRLLAKKPNETTIWIRRPHDGRVVRIEIAAGAAAGGSLVGDWSAGAIFDEFTRMNGEDEGSAINFDDSRKAVLGRLLPGAQLVGVGSPWAPRGPAYEIVQTHWGKPSSRIVVLRPPARAMNPVYWTDERIAELRSSPKGEWVFRTDFLGEFADPESAFFALAELEAVARTSPVHAPRAPGLSYFAAMDPATRRNAWTLVIGGREFLPNGSFRLVVAYARQWMPRPGAPLVPELVMDDIKADLGKYGLSEVHTDQWSADTIAAIGRMKGFTVTEVQVSAADDVRMFDALRLHVQGKTIELHPDPYVKGDLLAVRKVVTNRSMKMVLPITSDGRHCDFAPPTRLLCELASSAPSWLHAMQQLPEGAKIL